jgi:hypothetical protein
VVLSLEERSKRKKEVAEEERKAVHARVLLEQEQERVRYEQTQAAKRAAAAAAAARSGAAASLLAGQAHGGSSVIDDDAEKAAAAVAGADEEIEEEMQAAAEMERLREEEAAGRLKPDAKILLPASTSSCDLNVPLHSHVSGGIAHLHGHMHGLTVKTAAQTVTGSSNSPLIASFSSPHLSALGSIRASSGGVLSIAATAGEGAMGNTAGGNMLPTPLLGGYGVGGAGGSGGGGGAALPAAALSSGVKLSRIQREVAKLSREGVTHVVLLLTDSDFVEMGVDALALRRAFTDEGIKQMRVPMASGGGPTQMQQLIDLVQVAINVLCEKPAAASAAASSSSSSTAVIQSPSLTAASATTPATAAVPPAIPKLLLISKSGFHRAGTLAACVLCALGLSVDVSIRLVREARGARSLGREAREQLVRKFDHQWRQFLIERVLHSGELFHSTIMRNKQQQQQQQASSSSSDAGGSSTISTSMSSSNAASTTAAPWGSALPPTGAAGGLRGAGSSSEQPAQVTPFPIETPCGTTNRSLIQRWPAQPQ